MMRYDGWRFNKHMTNIGKNWRSGEVWRGIREYRPMIEGYTDFFFSFFVLVIFFNFSQVVHPETTGVKPASEICKGLRFQYWKLCEELILYWRPEFLSVTIRDLRPLQHVMAAVSFIWSQVMSTYVYNMDKAVRRLEGTEWGECSDPMDPHGMIWPLGSLGVAGSLLRSGKEVVFIFPPMELQPKIFQRHKAGFPVLCEKKTCKDVIPGRLYAQHITACSDSQI